MTFDPRTLKVNIALIMMGAYALLFFPYWQALVIGCVLGCSIHYAARFLRQKYQFIGRRSELVCMFFFFTLTALLFYVMSSHFIQLFQTQSDDENLVPQITQSFGKAKVMVSHGIQGLLGTESFNSATIEKFLNSLLMQLQNGLLGLLQGVITNLPGAALGLTATLITCIYFAVGSPHSLDQYSPFKVLSKHSPISWLAFESICASSVGSLLFVGMAQATIITGACMFIHTPNPVLIFLVTFFLSFIPMLGAGAVPFFMMIYYYSVGDISSSVVMLGAFGVGGTIDNVLRAALFSKMSNSNAIVSFFAVIGAILLFGLPGLLIAPVLEQLAMKAFDEVLKSSGNEIAMTSEPIPEPPSHIIQPRQFTPKA